MHLSGCWVISYICSKSENQLDKKCGNTKLCSFIQLLIHFISEVTLKCIPWTDTLNSTYNCPTHKSISWLVPWNLRKIWSEGELVGCAGLCYLWGLCGTNVCHELVRYFFWPIVIINTECLKHHARRGIKHFTCIICNPHINNVR